MSSSDTKKSFCSTSFSRCSFASVSFSLEIKRKWFSSFLFSIEKQTNKKRKRCHRKSKHRNFFHKTRRVSAPKAAIGGPLRACFAISGLSRLILRENSARIPDLGRKHIILLWVYAVTKKLASNDLCSATVPIEISCLLYYLEIRRNHRQKG